MTDGSHRDRPERNRTPEMKPDAKAARGPARDDGLMAAMSDVDDNRAPPGEATEIGYADPQLARRPRFRTAEGSVAAVTGTIESPSAGADSARTENAGAGSARTENAGVDSARTENAGVDSARNESASTQRSRAERVEAPNGGAAHPSSKEGAAYTAAIDGEPTTVEARRDTPADGSDGGHDEIAAQRTATGVPNVRVRYFGRTDVGLVREHNEDNFLVADLSAGSRSAVDEPPAYGAVKEQGLIFAVCDGMGGAAAGEVASQMAVDTLYETMEGKPVPTDRDEFARRLVRAIEEAGHRIYSAAKMDRTRRGMGTTATLAGLVDNMLFIGQVGDSRAYILRGEQFEQVTKDQSLVNQLIEAGQLTEEEAEAFEHSNIILQALGTTEDVTVDLTFLELRQGDRLLMCSDGLSGLVHADMMRDALRESAEPDKAAEQLIEMANAGGGHDNITVVIADFEGEGLTGDADTPVAYRQYPLPVEETAKLTPVPPRRTNIKRGGPKPGADVKGEDFDAVPLALSTAGLGRWFLGGLGVVVLVLGALLFFLMRSPPPNAANERQRRASEAARRAEAARPPAQGWIHVHTDVEAGTLWVNGRLHGPLHDGMTLALSPNAYSLEARHGETRIAEAVVTVGHGERVDANLIVPSGTLGDPGDGLSPTEPPPGPPRTATPEPRPTEPHLREPHLPEPRLAEPRLAEPRLAEPDLSEPALPDRSSAVDVPAPTSEPTPDPR